MSAIDFSKHALGERCTVIWPAPDGLVRRGMSHILDNLQARQILQLWSQATVTARSVMLQIIQRTGLKSTRKTAETGR